MGTPNSILRRTLEFSDAEFYWIWSNEFCIWLKNLENWKDKRILRQQTIRALAIFVEENASHQKVEYLNRRWDWCQKQLHDFNFSDVWDSARAWAKAGHTTSGLINWIRAFSGTTQSARLAPKDKFYMPIGLRTIAFFKSSCHISCAWTGYYGSLRDFNSS